MPNGVRSPSYPHWFVIQRRSDRGAGTQDPSTGAYVRPTGTADIPTVLYEDWADVQPSTRVLARDADGTPVLTADAVAYLADESAIGEIAENDVALVHWEDGRVDDAQVAKIDRLSGAIYLRNL